MAATVPTHCSSPATRCSLLPRGATPFRPSFFTPVSSVRTNCSVGFTGLSSSATAYSRQRLVFCRNFAGQHRLRHRSPAVSASSEGNGNETDPELAAADPDSGATIDLKLPRRRLLVEFTCNECGERTSRLVNPLAYERGLVYVQCAGCLRHHKLVDNLGLVMEYDLREETNVKSERDRDIYP